MSPQQRLELVGTSINIIGLVWGKADFSLNEFKMCHTALAAPWLNEMWCSHGKGFTNQWQREKWGVFASEFTQHSAAMVLSSMKANISPESKKEILTSYSFYLLSNALVSVSVVPTPSSSVISPGWYCSQPNQPAMNVWLFVPYWYPILLV